MAQMFQILSQTNVVITVMANQRAVGDPPYGMPYGWKIEGPVIEEHEQQNVVNNEGAKVMDIRPTNSCLLGKPWIHATREVPSSLHQKVKFIDDQQLISMMGEKELKVSTPLPTEYVEGDREALETSFQALEIVGTTSVEAEEGGSKLSKETIMATKVIISNDFQPDKGLGRGLDGIAKLIALQENLKRFGLGYIGL
ncbi:hypothetical protein CR513_33938, partial [Mucuna pruriens]